MHRQNSSDSMPKRRRRGQSMIEYALILALVTLALLVALAATGPAVGNVFSNTIFNLLGQTAEPRTIGSVNDFWLTVTWAAQQTPLEFPLPTRTLGPPSLTPTEGPSPTPTPVTPTATPIPTSTPTLTPTPEDLAFIAPYNDPIDDPVRWRTDKDVTLGTDDWFGQYFAGTQLDYSGATPDWEFYNGEIDPTLSGKVNFNYGSGSPISGSPPWLTNNFSIRWTKNIYVDSDTTVKFTVAGDDGYRLWLDYSPGCSGFSGEDSGAPQTSNSNDDTHDDPSTDCLLIGDWENQGTDTSTVTRTIPAGPHVLQLDYYESTGGSNISIGWESPGGSNVDDVELTGGTTDCNWGRQDSDRSNTLQWMWEEYLNSDFRQNMRCHLELRGYVEIPPGFVKPEFTFWDYWDFQNASLNFGWVEVAEYAPVGDPARSVPGYWIQVPLHQGNTTNYNWSRQFIDLSDVRGDGTATTDDNFIGKNVEFRFVMENGNNSSTRRWYIDDIEIVDSTQKNFHLGLPAFTLDTAGAADDFITSGRWELTSNNAHGGSGMSWDDSPGDGDVGPGQWPYTEYDSNWESPSGYEQYKVRIHSLEFNGWIDTSEVLGATDIHGDTGSPLLSFWHGFNVGSRTGLEVQFTTDPYSAGNAANWQAIPNFGVIRPISDSGELREMSMDFVELPLDGIGASRYRLRFAMLLPQNTDEKDGWWIDDILLERRGLPQFSSFPFFENSEGGTTDWLLGGTWGITSESGLFGSFNSFTDTPFNDYLNNSNSSMELFYPFDFNNDTPLNVAAFNCSLGPDCTFSGVQAFDPMLTFWHRRDFQSGENFYVEWKPWDADDTGWTPIWAYIDRMTTYGSSSSSRTREQLGWERVEIDLRPIFATFDPDPFNYTDDDIQFRFRLSTNGSSTADGIYLDDIAFDERVEVEHRLWPTGENRDDASGNNIGLGNGETSFDDIDTPVAWWERWWTGGSWNVITWNQHSGLNAFHDSPGDLWDFDTSNDQIDPFDGPGSSPDQSVYIPPTDDTFNVLEMRTIFDLRATQLADEPTLYFWSRWYVGDDDFARVQIAVEDPSLGALCSNGLAQCYEHLYQWSEWQTVWSHSQWDRDYTYTREQVALDGFIGKRIRIRFVSDALDNNNNRDGWYVDDVSVKFRNPAREFAVRKNPDNKVFFDAARSMQNWVPEGIWGLSPEFFRGAGGGPAALGADWTYYFWDCGSCNGPSGANSFLNGNPTSSSPDDTGVVTDINIDPGFGNVFTDGGGTGHRDTLAGRWELFTPSVGAGLAPGEYTFITISDDGVRLKYDTVPAGGVSPGGWNIIENWTNHGRTVDMGTASFALGNTYKITLEYYEASSRAVIVLSVGSTNFSFTDSPKQGAGDAFAEVHSVRRGNSSLLLDGLLDFTDATAPAIEYYTYYELGGTAWVEISPDGGFTWGESAVSGYRSMLSPGGFDDPAYGGTYMPNNGDWQRREHDLSFFAGQKVGLRFRLDRRNNDDTNRTSQSPTDWLISWWVTDIRIIDP